jgi:capsular polysaccharide biosynthesis protein
MVRVLLYVERNMEFSDYLRILRQRGWLIILVAVLTAIAAFGFSKMRYRAQAVINQLQLDRTSADLLGDIRVASDNSSFVIELTVENTDPDLANDIARTWGNLLIQWQVQNNDTLRKEDRITIEFIDDPQASLDRPKWKVNTAAGGVFGALLGVLVVFLLEWIESGIVRRPEDIERYLEIPVIGTIPGQ